jgi:peroxiredoxin
MVEERGARLVVVLCQDPVAARAYFDAHPVPYPVAIDQERKVAKAYGVYRLLSFDSVHIARPATFIVDAGGIIRHRFVAQVQWQKMPIDEVLGVLGRVNPNGSSAAGGRSTERRR